jgi:hypothetical protein
MLRLHIIAARRGKGAREAALTDKGIWSGSGVDKRCKMGKGIGIWSVGVSERSEGLTHGPGVKEVNADKRAQLAMKREEGTLTHRVTIVATGSADEWTQGSSGRRERSTDSWGPGANDVQWLTCGAWAM